MKICTKCGVSKDLSLFSPNKKCKDGLQTQCRSCRAEYTGKWKLANPEKNAEYSRNWKLANPTTHIEYSRKWKLTNPEKNKQYSKNWKKNNPEKNSENRSKRRASELNEIPNWTNTEFEQFAIEEMYKLARLRTKLTGAQHHVDHIVPIKSNIVQGLHCLANLQILEAKENLAKGNRYWPNMPDYVAGKK